MGPRWYARGGGADALILTQMLPTPLCFHHLEPFQRRPRVEPLNERDTSLPPSLPTYQPSLPTYPPYLRMLSP